MPTRTLICTFGFTERKTLAAMRSISYNRLVLVAGKDVLERKELRLLVELESKGGGVIDTIFVDVFDFEGCYRLINETIRERMKNGEVVLNISGGTKILADAAILAAFQNGVEAYHCDERVIRLPVLRGVKFEDSFSSSDRKVLDVLGEGDTTKDVVRKLENQGLSEAAIRTSLRNLEKVGVVKPRLEGGLARIYMTEGHRMKRTQPASGLR